MTRYPMTINFFGLVADAPIVLELYDALDARYSLVWPDQLTTAFRLGTGPLNQELQIRSFELMPQRMVFSLTEDHDLVQLRLLVETDARFIRGSVRIPNDAYVELWTPYDELRLLGSGNYSLFVS